MGDHRCGKMISMNSPASDLSFNLVHTLYAIFIHNYILLAYLGGLLLSILISLKRPSRFALFLLMGFVILVFSFEYDKHIADGLRKQTLQSLITAVAHTKVEKWVNLVIGEILPIFFYILGWGLIYVAIVIGGWRRKSESKRN